MNILIVNSQKHIGGADTFSKNIFLEYKKIFDKVDIFENPITAKHLVSIILRKYDLIIFNLYYPRDLILVFLARLFFTESILVVHGIFFLVSKSMNPKQKVWRSIYEWFSQYLMFIFTSKIVSVCKFEFNQLITYFPFIGSKISIIYGAPDHKLFFPANTHQQNKSINKKGVNLLICSRFERRKGLDIALKSFKKVLIKFPDSRLKFIFPSGVFNQSDYMVYIFTLINKLKIGNNVELFTGISGSDLRKHYQKADIFIMSSKELEYCSLAVMESISCGCPVVTFKSGGTPEIIGDIGREYIINKISTNALTDRIAWYAKLPPVEKDKWRSKTATISKKYTWEKTSREIINLINPKN
jgi:glycosyltransferase involved in cell wall biosynthesis